MSEQNGDDGKRDVSPTRQPAGSRQRVPPKEARYDIDEHPDHPGPSPHNHPGQDSTPQSGAGQQGASQSEVAQRIPPQEGAQQQQPHQQRAAQTNPADSSGVAPDTGGSGADIGSRLATRIAADDTGILLSPAVARLGALVAAGYLAGAYIGIAPAGVVVLAWTVLEMELSN